MFSASHQTIKLLAAFVWYIGFVVLFIKSYQLVFEAEQINPGQFWTWVSIVCGIIFGIIKAKYLYKKLCIKNLNRINIINHPKLWHIYRPHFYVLLFCMVSLGAYFSRQAHGNYEMLLTIAFVDISVGTALLGSSHCFWKEQNTINER